MNIRKCKHCKNEFDILLTEHKNIVIIKTLEECKNFEITGQVEGSSPSGSATN